MRHWLALVLLLCGAPLAAQDYPALHRVVGVAANDVLNIRERPSAQAPILGVLPPDATGVEVLSIQDGWALVAAGEGAGHVAARFLRREDGPGWSALQTPLVCSGTEPFWSLRVDAAAGLAEFLTPELSVPETWQIGTLWPGQPWAPTAAMALPDGFAVLTPAACSDGMSDRPYGIAVEVFGAGTATGRLAGCCSLVER